MTRIGGMGLLPLGTVFSGDKVQRQTKGAVPELTGILAPLSGLSYEGYEIHMGRSGELPPVISNGDTYGTYVHGVFDAPGIAETVLRALCSKKGADISELGSFDQTAYRETQYDRLADAVRGGLDMDLIYRIVDRTDM